MMRRSAGYTILEAMIFLAVSGALFALVIPSYSSRQDKVRFTQGVRDLDSKINDVINDVSNGYYPNADSPCVATPSGPSFSGAVTEQGTRKDCIFVGKVIHLDKTDTQKPAMDIFSTVGLREVSPGTRVTTVAQAKPKTATDAGYDISERYELVWAPNLDFVRVVNSSPIDVGSVAIFTDLAQTTTTKKPDIIGVRGSSTTDTRANAITNINNTTNLTTGYINPDKGIIICLSDTGSAQQAAILIGGRAGIAKTEAIFDKPNIDAIESNICG